VGATIPSIALNGVEDRLDHSVDIRIDLGVGKSQRSEALPLEVSVALTITRCDFVKPVLCAINLDNQSVAQADEIENVAITRRLPAEMDAMVATKIPEAKPQPRFLRRQRFTQIPGAGDRVSGHFPTPSLSLGPSP